MRSTPSRAAAAYRPARPPPRRRPPRRPCRARSPRRARGALARVERVLQGLEHAHDAQAALAVGAGTGPLADRADEVLALDAQRLDVRDPRAVDVARAHHVLAPVARVLVEAL